MNGDGDVDTAHRLLTAALDDHEPGAGFEHVLGIAPSGGGFDSGIVERQATGGWVVAHELAHSYGWTEDAATAHHLNDEPALSSAISANASSESRKRKLKK